MANNCYYKLTLSKIKKNEKKNGDKLLGTWLSLKELHQLNFNEKLSFKLSSKATENDSSITLYSLKIHKRIGTHNSIDAEFLMVHTVKNSQVIDFNGVVDYFSDLSVKLESSTNGSAYFTVADNYCVVSVNPRIIRKQTKDSDTEYTIQLSLHIKSWDYFMDMTKYSRAYTRKKLDGDILTKMMESYDLGNGNETPIWTTNTSGMRTLKLVTKYDSKDVNIELCLPYLVQYNETDYNFLLRNANRCGEFLYFEHGVLNLGLTKIMNGTEEKKTTISDFSAMETIKSAEAFDEAESFSYNPLGSASGNTSKKKNYVSEIINDDFFDVLRIEGYDSAGAWNDVQAPWWFRVLGIVMQYEYASLFMEETAANETKIGIYSSNRANENNKNYQKKYFNSTDITNNATAYDDKGKLHTPFADFYSQKDKDGKDVTSHSGDIPADNRPDSMLFKKKSDAIRKRAHTQYKLTFDSSQKEIQLGDIVNIGGINNSKDFVVVDICSNSSVVNSSWTNNMEITLLSTEEKDPLPLPADVEMIRKSGAQSAVVAHSDDPKRLGRVRIRYHWQTKTDDASPWIRVSVPFASDEDSGTFHTLTPGDEVMVDYESGNIERPYVVGSLYNQSNRPPFGQREYSQIIRSRNGHTIGFREPTNASTIYKDILPGVAGAFSFIPAVSKCTEYANSQQKHRDTLRAMGGIDITDSYGIYSISTSSDKRKISISSPFGTVDMDAAMGISISAPNGEVSIKGKNVKIEAGNNLTIKSGTNIEHSLVSTFGKWDKFKTAALNEGLMAIGGFAHTLYDFTPDFGNEAPKILPQVK